MASFIALPAHDRPDALPGWRPHELGLGRAAILACALVVGLCVGLARLAAGFAVPAPPPPVAVRLVEPAAMPPSTMAETTTPPLAAPASVSPAPAPEPAAASIPQASSLPEAASDLALAATPDLVPTLMPELARPVPAVSKPIKHLRRVPVTHPAPRPETVEQPEASKPAMAQAAPVSVAPPAPRPATPAPPDTTSGLGAYQSALHRQIARNMEADETVARLGVGGTAVIVASIAPDGRLVEARIARSSGNRAIDGAALGAVQRGGFAAFGLHMPAGPITISVPITVAAD